MACCKCCCERPGYGGTCCGEAGLETCCPPGRPCCYQTCCDSDNYFCCGSGANAECCLNGRACCDGTCCNEGESCCDGQCCDGNCCDGQCQEEPCGCESDADCEGFDVCCDGQCCDGNCCDGVCCAPGESCCDGQCQEGTCDECQADLDCYTCEQGVLVAGAVSEFGTAYACCPEGSTGLFPVEDPRAGRCCEDCSAGSDEEGLSPFGQPTPGHCCDGQCQETECPP